MMKEDYQISRLKKEDVASAVTLVKETFDTLFLIPSIYRAKGVEKFIQNEIENPLSAYQFYAVKGAQNKIISFCEFRKIGDVAFLNMIATHPTTKGTGVGTSLLDYCIRYYQKELCTSIMLDVSFNNEIAYKWYILKGFKIKSAKYLSKLYVENLRECKCNIQILNYPQHKSLTSAYGFSMLEVSSESCVFKFGFIKDSLFLRGEWNNDLLNTMYSLSSSLEITNLYVIDEKPLINKAFVIDKIARMELNISGHVQ